MKIYCVIATKNRIELLPKALRSVEDQTKMPNKIILHACCAICSGYPIMHLKKMGYIPVVYFYNPNIYPENEYQRRLEAERTLCRYLDVELIEGEYNPQDFYNAAKGFENEPEKGARCDRCFELRLKKTAQLATKMGISEFTTSIVISPHKNFAKLTQIGESIAQQFDLTYKAIDFKKQDGFLKSNTLAKSLNLYRQHYCGCKFAIS